VTTIGIIPGYPTRKVQFMRTLRIFAAALGIAAFAAPPAAFAQQTPAAPGAGPPPSYARQAANGEETIHGRIASFDGKYQLSVHDDRGFIDNVNLHQGTVINPTGLSLQPGMAVTIMGYNRGRSFAANEIDTPYASYGYAPAYPYPVSVGIGFGPVIYHRY
jgi:hypothetical protein